MLHDLPSYRARCQSALSLDDLTMVLAVRLHGDNPWVAERLAAMAAHYTRLPKTVVVDFGSAAPYRERLAAVCAAHGFCHVYVDDSDTFSLARARNVGASASTTRLVFFNDVDCFSGADFFERLLEHANRLEMGAYLEQVINLPVYHFGEAETQRIWRLPEHERGEGVAREMTRKVYRPFDVPGASYVDPSSNFFVIRRDFFELTGGYNENFRGHGSEDFEFFLRLSHFTNQFPLPSASRRNLYSPVEPTFFGHKRYRGFRRYMELMAYQAECAGLRIAHLDHPRGAGTWYRHGDIGRQRLEAEIQGFLQQPSRLIDRDWMPRAKDLLVLLKHERQYQYFLSLRLKGYRLHLMQVGDPESEARGTRLIEDGAVDGVAVFNPYMGSHKALAPWVELTRRRGIPLTVVDRGMLPESWFFAADMPYADPEYGQLDLGALEFTEAELALAAEYASRLRLGLATLEANGDFEATRRRRAASGSETRTVLIPLQLDDDVAVTRFNAGYEPYPKFVADIESVARQYRDVRFLVKPHPLSKRSFEVDAANITTCDREDNIHALIELSDAVICYNSGAGFLALVHEKPLVTVGNAFYNLPGTGRRAANLAEAVRIAGELAEPSPERMLRFLAWHIFHKYAFFKATSQLSEHPNRQAHHYRDLTPYALPQGALTALRVAADYPSDGRSYAAGKVSLFAGPLTKTVLLWNGEPPLVRKLRKLMRDPQRFARDTKLGRKLLG